MIRSLNFKGIDNARKAVAGRVGTLRSISIDSDHPKKRFVSMTVPEKDEECHLKNILENNKKWVAEMKTQDSAYFEKLSKPQRPKYLYIGCADSRVPANEILGLGWGLPVKYKCIHIHT